MTRDDKTANSNPNNVGASIELGLRHHQSGDLSQAESVYRQILAKDPNNSDALYLLGLIAFHFGHAAAALQLASRAVSIRPSSSLYQASLAKALAANSRLEEAEAACRKSLALNERDFNTWATLGDLLFKTNRFAEAADSFRAALKLAPDRPEFLRALGELLMKQSRVEEAIEQFDKAIALAPNSVGILNDLGCAEQARGDFDKAIAWYESVLKIDPNLPEAHLNLSLALLCCGDLRRGLQEYEWRLKCPAWLNSGDHFPQPFWDGRTDLRGRRLLVHAEQGYGDTFQLLRYVPSLAERGAHIIFGCRRELEPLVRNVPGVSEMLLVGSAVPSFELQVHLASMPLLSGTTLETIPGPVPYLFADPARKAEWRSRVESAGGRLKVGLAWRGQPLPDPGRSFRLQDATALANFPGVVFHSLQKGPGSEEAANPPAGVTLIDHAHELADFGETAALIANLDLVVSIDSAAAHLAGSMGKDALTLLPFVASYQWLRDRDDSPWYPATKLIRQRSRGDWQGVFDRVAAEISARLI